MDQLQKFKYPNRKHREYLFRFVDGTNQYPKQTVEAHGKVTILLSKLSKAILYNRVLDR